MGYRSELEDFDPSKPVLSGIDTLIIGCGNILRGDDAHGTRPDTAHVGARAAGKCSLR